MNVRLDQATQPAASLEQCSFERESDELNACKFAGLFVTLYARLRGPGSSFVRRQLVRMLSALEGGQMRSKTLRHIMQRVHGIEIGAHSYGCFDPVRFPPGTRVGRYVSVGPGVSAYRRNHPVDRLSMHPYFYRPSMGAGRTADVETAPLNIGAGSWLGAQVIILPGCRRIGRGAVVAAGAVLTRDVEDYAVVGGNPARLIKYRFSEEDILAAEATWWWQQKPEEVVNSHEISRPWTGQDQVISWLLTTSSTEDLYQ
mgnify:CR=1 FL=1